MTKEEARKILTELIMKQIEKKMKGEDTSIIDIEIKKIKRKYSRSKLEEMQKEQLKGFNK